MNRLSFNALKFLNEYSIDKTINHPHCTPNRVNIHCPFCKGSRDFHLGIHLINAYGNCWRCGPHSILEIIHEILNISWREAYRILDEYSDVSGISLRRKKEKIKLTKVKLPVNLRPLIDLHKQYITDRKFSSEKIEDVWGIKSTDVIGDYKHRIFIPIFYRGEIVSFQCRTPYEHVGLRYKTCAKPHEKIHHKHILYGIDNVVDDTIVVVEGVTDVWRLGPGAVSTFGLGYTREQVFLISKFKNIFILFDNEPAAQETARKLAEEVAYITKKGRVIVVNSKTSGDPGDLPQEEANKLMLNIQLRAL